MVKICSSRPQLTVGRSLRREIGCILIISAIYGLVVGVAAATSDDLKPLDPDAKAVLGAAAILGVVYVVGVIMFQIWTIIVANKARKEIEEGIKI